MLLLGLIVGVVTGVAGLTTWIRVKAPLGIALQRIGALLIS